MQLYIDRIWHITTALQIVTQLYSDDSVITHKIYCSAVATFYPSDPTSIKYKFTDLKYSPLMYESKSKMTFEKKISNMSNLTILHYMVIALLYLA